MNNIPKDFKFHIISEMLKHMLKDMNPAIKEDRGFSMILEFELNDRDNRIFLERYIRMLKYRGAYKKCIEVLTFIGEDRYKLEIKALEKKL